MQLLRLVIGLKDAPVFQPGRLKTKTSSTLYARFFARLGQVPGKAKLVVIFFLSGRVVTRKSLFNHGASKKERSASH